MKKSVINETSYKVYQILLERFGAPLKKSSLNDISETRIRVGREELETTWEDLYMENGPPTVAELASWLGASEDAVMAALPNWLIVDENEQIVER